MGSRLLLAPLGTGPAASVLPSLPAVVPACPLPGRPLVSAGVLRSAAIFSPCSCSSLASKPALLLLPACSPVSRSVVVCQAQRHTKVHDLKNTSITGVSH